MLFVDLKPLTLMKPCFLETSVKGSKETVIDGSIPRRRAAAGGGETDLSRNLGLGHGETGRWRVSVVAGGMRVDVVDLQDDGSSPTLAHCTVGDGGTLRAAGPSKMSPPRRDAPMVAKL